MILSERLQERMAEQIRKKKETRFEAAGSDYVLRWLPWEDLWQLIELIPGQRDLIVKKWTEDECSVDSVNLTLTRVMENDVVES